MKRHPLLFLFIFGILFWGLDILTFGAEAPQSSEKTPAAEQEVLQEEFDVQAASSEEIPPLDKVAPDATKISGLIPMYQKKERLYLEIGEEQQNTDYIIIISIARGLAGDLYGGMSWLPEDEDMIWQFRKVDDRIQIVRRNFKYQAEPGTPEEKSLRVAFTDSVLFSLPIVAKGKQGGDVIDLTPIFMSDLPMISANALPGFSFDVSRSTWAKVKGHKDNLEVEVAATFAGSGRGTIDTVMDTRGISINIHYSISKLEKNDYQPRLADERVGYFTTVIKNLSKNQDDDNFIRYINRWNLQKLEPQAEYSLPKKPIIFWLEKTVPYQYRKPLRDGILE